MTHTSAESCAKCPEGTGGMERDARVCAFLLDTAVHWKQNVLQPTWQHVNHSPAFSFGQRHTKTADSRQKLLSRSDCVCGGWRGR